jgi:methyltransferase-like protein 6
MNQSNDQVTVPYKFNRMSGKSKTPEKKTPKKIRRRVDGSPIVPKNPNLPIKRVYLIRHAESIGQASRLLGWDRKNDNRLVDCGLTEKGKSQSLGMKKLFSDEDFDLIELVISSPLTRALQTALMAFPQKDILVAYPLREIGSKVPENQPRSMEHVLKDLSDLLVARPDSASFDCQTLRPADWPRDYTPSVVRRDQLRALFRYLYHERHESVFAIVCHFNVIRSMVTDGSSLKPSNAAPIACNLHCNGDVVVSHLEETKPERSVQMTQNEYSMAASYYSFFNKIKAHNNKHIIKEQEWSASENAASSQDFWTEDVWTALDEKAAEHWLKEHLEKCSIQAKPFQKPAGNDAKAWDQFYSQHGTRFFKDRHYLEKAFPDEFCHPIRREDGVKGPLKQDPLTLIEIGCGVGNAILPLTESETGRWGVIHGLDISEQAIRLLQQDARFLSFNEKGASKKPKRAIFGHVCDVSKTLPPELQCTSDLTTLLFCLSAIDPSMMPHVIMNVASTLKPGGRLVFRDYGRYDEAQMKLGTSRCKRIKENFYQKHDGTKCYYFTVEEVTQMFGSTGGLDVLEVVYLRRVYGNKASGQRRRRVWVQGRFQKPI